MLISRHVLRFLIEPGAGRLRFREERRPYLLIRLAEIYTWGSAKLKTEGHGNTGHNYRWRCYRIIYGNAITMNVLVILGKTEGGEKTTTCECKAINSVFWDQRVSVRSIASKQNPAVTRIQKYLISSPSQQGLKSNISFWEANHPFIVAFTYCLQQKDAVSVSRNVSGITAIFASNSKNMH